ncbi:zinc ribbon domain-containing protein [Ottowia thiooxydans]|uniref:zinc ribbon domain-containing protein n=1 Tax=Ottowia thiooxydans TaxID=219182 RepID=UPI000490B207|nr:zinc ribbon domain-containing protein [Ottowia thiooxydans]
MKFQADAGVLRLRECIILGGSGFPFASGETVGVLLGKNGLTVHGSAYLVSISLVEIAELNIAGPGSVTTGGSFVGGGFGVASALEGMAIAGVLNALTSRTKIHTFISLITNFGELHLHYGDLEPSALRIALSDVFVKLRSLEPSWQPSRLRLLEAEHSRGGITQQQFDDGKSRLVSDPTWSTIADESRRINALRDAGARDEFERAPKGICPNCDAVIALHSEKCPKCEATFGVGSAWAPTPIAE